LISAGCYGALVTSLYFVASHPRFHAPHVLMTALRSGASILAYVRLQVAWFERRKGFTLGLTLSGVGIAAVVIPPLSQWIIRSYGWRDVYLGLGAITLLICWPLLFLVIRNSPEECGSHIDGMPPSDRTPDSSALSRMGYTLLEVLRRRTFWTMTAAMALIGFGAGLHGHHVHHLRGGGSRGKLSRRAIFRSRR
jgi:MFS family permease